MWAQEHGEELEKGAAILVPCRSGLYPRLCFLTRSSPSEVAVDSDKQPHRGEHVNVLGECSGQ